ncbi:MAG TPA: OmpA family protein [Kofleriaceae bacterium]|nr:OmpA family protein [Kofleriaceae bacterium]
MMFARSRRRPVLLAAGVAAAVAAAGLAGCHHKQADTTVATAAPPVHRPPHATAPATPPETQTATLTPTGPTSEAAPDFAPIRFDFDSADLSEAARDELEQVSLWLAKNQAQLTIEGNADERGTTEYNLALGQQRAEAIARHLSRLGIAAARLHTISYGEERPVADGSDEQAWAANRRGELHPR